jgi:hypothetical protein
MHVTNGVSLLTKGIYSLVDDESVEPIDESMVQSFFGSSQEYSNNTDHGYILFYEMMRPETGFAQRILSGLQ